MKEGSSVRIVRLLVVYWGILFLFMAEEIFFCSLQDIEKLWDKSNLLTNEELRLI
jgi:hypothetical protein